MTGHVSPPGWTLRYPFFDIGTMFSERALFFEMCPQGQNALFDFGGGAITGSYGLVDVAIPIDTVESFSLSVIAPVFDGHLADAKSCCNGTKGLTVANCRNDVPSCGGREGRVADLSEGKGRWEKHSILLAIEFCAFHAK
jgi:hypothetical protein